MIKTSSIIIIVLFFFGITVKPQSQQASGTISGQVISENGKPVQDASMKIKYKSMEMTTDENGFYQFLNLPEGIHVISAQHSTHLSKTIATNLKSEEEKIVNFVLAKTEKEQEKKLNKTDRDASSFRTDSPANIITTVRPSNADHILSFSPGLRSERNNQSWSFSQVRMNGMESSQSQTLINNQPVFRGLASVYGIEILPPGLIDKVEISHGINPGLHQSNSIAGTINVKLKEPTHNFYELESTSSIVGAGSNDSWASAMKYSAGLNTSFVSPDKNSGMLLHGHFLDKQPFDANNDDLPEQPGVKNTTLGGRFYHKLSPNSKLTADFFNVSDKTSSGQYYGNLPHTTVLTELVDQSLNHGTLSFEQIFPQKDMLSIYFSGQSAKWDTYFGAERSLDDYRKSDDLSYSAGGKYQANFNNYSLTLGIENASSHLRNQNMGHPDWDNLTYNTDEGTITIPFATNSTLSDQETNTLTGNALFNFHLTNITITAGARYDHYEINDKTIGGKSQSDNIISPSVNAIVNLTDNFKARLNYAHGYRLPKIYPGDFYIKTSASRQIFTENATDLELETSQSYRGSIEFNQQLNNNFMRFFIEGFYTQINDAFYYDFGVPNEAGTVLYTRTNASDGATVKGINFGFNYRLNQAFLIKGGLTLENNEYTNPQEFNEKRFFRTPNDYGFFILEYEAFQNFTFSTTSNYTGKMLIPYFGNQLENPETGILKESDIFYELGLKLKYNIHFNNTQLQIYAGANNLLNAYQDDFDEGITRDPAYVYGPLNPRTMYFGLKIGNIIK